MKREKDYYNSQANLQICSWSSYSVQIETFHQQQLDFSTILTNKIKHDFILTKVCVRFDFTLLLLTYFIYRNGVRFCSAQLIYIYI